MLQLGKLTISTGPFSMSLCNKLPEGTHQAFTPRRLKTSRSTKTFYIILLFYRQSALPTIIRPLGQRPAAQPKALKYMFVCVYTYIYIYVTMIYLIKQGCMVISFIIESCPCLSIKREFRRAEGRSKLSVIKVPKNPIKQFPIAIMSFW